MSAKSGAYLFVLCLLTRVCRIHRLTCSHILVDRTRIGVVCFVVSFALLTGNPISGALLKPPHYEWQNPILFSGVSLVSLCA